MKPSHCLRAVKISGQSDIGIRDINKSYILGSLTGLIMCNLDAAQRATPIEIDNRTVWRGWRCLIHIVDTNADAFWTCLDHPDRVHRPKAIHRL